MTATKISKYKSTPHLIDSRLGDGDYHVDGNLHNIIQRGGRDKRDTVYASLKLDGSNVSIVKQADERVLGFQRSGYPVETNQFENLKLLQKWINIKNVGEKFKLLPVGWRVVGEWLIQAVGTIYKKLELDDLFVVFAVYDEKGNKQPRENLVAICEKLDLFYVDEIEIPRLGQEKLDYSLIVERLCRNCCFGIKPKEHEGLVFRWEINELESGMVKWVKPDKVDGKFMNLQNDENFKPIWHVSDETLARLRA